MHPIYTHIRPLYALKQPIKATLREKWNLYGCSSESIRIPEFKDPSRSELRWNSALEQYEHYYPEWKRVLKYVIKTGWAVMLCNE